MEWSPYSRVHIHVSLAPFACLDLCLHLREKPCYPFILSIEDAQTEQQSTEHSCSCRLELSHVLLVRLSLSTLDGFEAFLRLFLCALYIVKV